MKATKSGKSSFLMLCFEFFIIFLFFTWFFLAFTVFSNSPIFAVWLLVFLLFLVGILRMLLFREFYNSEMTLKTRICYGLVSLLNFIAALRCLGPITIWNFGTHQYFYFKLSEFFIYLSLSILFGFGAYKSKRFPFFYFNFLKKAQKSRAR